jgi:cell division protease FtsH
VNCSGNDPFTSMMNLKDVFHDTSNIIAYHAIQSFKPHETNADTVHEIGVETATRLYGDRYQFVVCTHLDKDHLHNHIVLNPVSIVDGKRYHNSMKDIYQLREVSDEICKEYGLSIVEKPQGEGQSRSQYYSARSYIREIKKDIDAACIRAFTVKDFVQDMKLEGYSFEEVEGLDCVVHPNYDKPIPLLLLGQRYSLDCIEQRIEKEEVRELVDFLKTPKKFADMGAKIPRGVLLVGPPGTGKTLLARAVAGEANVPFYSISGSEFVEMFVGVGAGRVRDMFKKAKQTAPCIIFIDEIDAVGRQRGTGMGGGHDEREQTLNQLLVEMDGFSGNEGIIVLAATNRADVLDPALLRPGRFDRQIQVANPDKRARSQILKVHARNKRFTPDVNFDNIAQRTPGFSGAELSNVLNEAALLAVRQNHDLITMADIDEAVDRVMGGPAKKSRKYTERERRLVAYHEAGHALIGLTLEDANKVQKVTIVPRGQAGGYNLMTPKEETYFQTKSQLKATISGYMGGRVAEEVFFGDVSSGAHNDIEQATRIARMMVTELGMSELGPIQYDSENGQVFLGRDYTQRSNTHSGQIAYEIDVQVRKIIDACYQEATNIIEQNKEKLICIAEALLEHETLSGEDIESLYNTGKMLEHHDGTLTEEPVQEVKEEKPSIDDQDDLLDEMK